MSAVTLLDCTLRDGGNQNSWDFAPEAVHTLIESLDRAKVPFIEVGYRGGSGSNKAASVGPSARCDADYLASLPTVANSKLAAMVVPSACSVEKALDLAGSRVELVRVAVYPWDAHLAPSYIAALRDVGLRVTLNLMALSYVDDQMLRRIADSLLGDAAPEVFYVADSFGALTPARVRHLVGVLAGATDAAVGVHFHNNLGLAAANTLAAIEAGATWVDASLASMARGAGNLATEQAVAIFEAVGVDAPWIDAEQVARAGEYILNHVLDTPMKTSRNELLAGLNNHHYYLQAHIGAVSSDLSIDARELGRRVGQARPRTVSREVVLDIANTMISEGTV